LNFRDQPLLRRVYRITDKGKAAYFTYVPGDFPICSARLLKGGRWLELHHPEAEEQGRKLGFLGIPLFLDWNHYSIIYF